MLPFRPAVWLLAVTTLAAGCPGADDPDAYGTFEAVEITVSAETGGRLLRVAFDEGDKLDAGAVVAVVDTTQLVLEREGAQAQRAVAEARATEAARQIALLETEREIAERTYERTKRLIAQEAATAQQLDQAEREFRALGDRIAVARAQQRTAANDIRSTDARVALIAERLRRSEVTNPVAGTVLAAYADAGEFIQPGQPLYTIASLDTMTLRAYVTELQLVQVRLGGAVQVTIDTGREERRVLPGTVTWVSAEAEFTPTPIQTRDERADLVYAIKVRVANPDGMLKIGMPADIRLAGQGAAMGQGVAKKQGASTEHDTSTGQSTSIEQDASTDYGTSTEQDPAF